ncbi:MAG: HAD family hydrolase [Candidatus Hodarchaeota archaeon]
MVKFKAVFFDFGGTLFNYYPPNEEIWAKVAKEFGVEISSSDSSLIRAMVNQGIEFERTLMGPPPKKGSEFTRDDWDRFNRNMLLAIGIDSKDAVKRVQELFKEREGRYEIFDGCKKTLEILKLMNIRMGIISNSNSTLSKFRRNILKANGILKYFEVIILSSEVGIEKPDQRIFKLALDRMDIKNPNEVIYIGDNYYVDAIASKKAGMIPILFDPYGIRDVECLKIDHLTMIPQIIRSLD